MSEVRNLVETIERPRSVVLFVPAAGDDCDQASDDEVVPQDFVTAFEPAGELEVKEDIVTAIAVCYRHMGVFRSFTASRLISQCFC